jgi:ElaB/YqjD/DUF883 family membrane-anchored ribosome-binding protein
MRRVNLRWPDSPAERFVQHEKVKIAAAISPDGPHRAARLHQAPRSHTMSDASVSTLQAVGEKLAVARDKTIVGVADAVNAGVDAARGAKDRMGEGVDSLLDQGKDLLGDAAELVRRRPWAAIGIAVAVGYVIARISRRN